MKIDDNKLNKILHHLPILVAELKFVENRINELRQDLLKAIEEDED